MSLQALLALQPDTPPLFPLQLYLSVEVPQAVSDHSPSALAVGVNPK